MTAADAFGTVAPPSAVDLYAEVPPPTEPPEPGADLPTEEATDDTSPLGVIPPPQLPAAALSGVAGRVVALLAPHTEADPAALLATLLAWFGAVLGRAPHGMIANSEHPARVWPLIVGKTSGGAKGTSLQVIRSVMDAAAPMFAARVTSGLTSGEGLIEAVRDGSGGTDPDAPGFDEGVLDKRLLVIESEFATVLARGRREGSTLLPVLRDAWDGSPLQTMSRKANALHATGHHIVVVGHISPGELVSSVRSADLAGGTLNRFLFVHSRRAQLLPEGGNIPAEVLTGAAAAVARALAHAAAVHRVDLDAEALALWRALYPALVIEQDDGPVSSATARAAPQVRRLALAYALFDGATAVRYDHLAAAAELWGYSERTARWLFTSAAHDAETSARTQLLDFIAAAGPDGATRTAIRETLFQRHKSARAITDLLAPLIRSGQVTERARPGPGRSATVYTLTNSEQKD